MNMFLPDDRKLGDIEAAERYCTELGRPDAYMRFVFGY